MSEQDNDQLVVAFLMCLSDAAADTLNDPGGSDLGRVYKINGYRVNQKRLGQVLRAVKAMNA